MTNGFFKKTASTAADQARKTAQQIAREPYEILKSALPAGMKKESDNSSLVAEMVGIDDNQVGEKINEETVNTQAKKRLEELESEIEKIRQERKAKEEEWKKSQDALMQSEHPAENQFIEAQSKKRRGFMGFAKKKQGTKEMGKQVSG